MVDLSPVERLRRSLAGEIYTDGFTCGRYATDASIYQMVPRAVVVPQSLADVEATISCCREQGIALLPRGGGTAVRANSQPCDCYR